MKRTISVLLALVMVLAGVFAIIPASAATPEGTAISSEAEFLAIGDTGKYYLANDITITQINTVKFKGTLDGNGKTITIVGTKAAFNEITGATIKNLTIAGEIALDASSDAAGLSLYGSGKIDNVTNKVNISITIADATKSMSGKVGGIFAVVNDTTTITNCTNEGNFTLALEGQKADHYVGGIVGSNDDKMDSKKLVINGCTNKGTISSTQAAAYLGGIIGMARRIRLEMDSCVNNGAITIQQKWDPNAHLAGDALSGYRNGAYTAAAGMIGGTYQGSGSSGLSVLLTNCTNNASITALKGNNDFAHCLFVGGMMGRALHNNKFRAINCTNNGAITVPAEDTGWSGAGGMIGCMMTIGMTWSGAYDGLGNGDGETVMENCKNTGAINGRHSGGMWGSVYQMMLNDQVIKLQYCENSGKITGADHAGGMIGLYGDAESVASDITIKNCKNSGEVVANGIAAGIIAKASRAGTKKVMTIDSCINNGTVKTLGTSADSKAAVAAGIIGVLPNKCAMLEDNGSIQQHKVAVNNEEYVTISITNCVVSGNLVKEANNNDKVAITLDMFSSNVEKSGNIYKSGLLDGGSFATAKSEAECNTAISAIKTSVANVGTLEAAIANASGFVELNYTADSWTAYQNALTTAKETLKAYENLSQDKVDADATALQNAIDGLTLAPVDLSALNAAIAQVEGMNSKNYTSISWLRVDNAYKTAKVAVTSLYQSEINEALAELTSAIERLDEKANKGDSNNNTDDGADNGNGNTNSGDATDAPAGDNSGDATDAPAEEKEGCGSAITATAVVLTTVVALGAGVAFRKKED